MASRSKIYVIDDSTPEAELNPYGLAKGWLGASPRGAYGDDAGTPFPGGLLIPESEWIPRIQERIARKATAREMGKRAGHTVKNQSSLGYCWMFGTTNTLEYRRIWHGEPHVSLSPASVGGPLTGYRNVGGYGEQAIRGLVDLGAVPTSLWPDTSLDSRLYQSTFAERAKYKVDQWYILDSWQAVISYLFRYGPVSGGFNWWGHQVCLVDPVVIDGVVCPQIENSWGPDWQSDGGFAVLQGRRRIPDDAVAPRTALAA